MISRQRGVAHISIMWFIVMVVLFLGGVGFAYIQMQEVAKLTNLNTSLDSKNQRLNEELVSVEEAWLVRVRSVGFNGGDKEEPTQAEDVEKGLKQLRDLVGAGESVGTIEGVIPFVRTKFSKQNDRIEELVSDLATAEAERDQARNAKRDSDTEKQDTIDQERTNKAEIESNLRGQISNKEEELSKAHADIRKKNQEREDALTKWEGEKKVMRGQIADYRRRNKHLNEKFNFISDPDKIDGEIISASPKLSRAWVNLGTNQMVKAGMQFEVLEARGNTLVHKAWALVISPEGNSSEVVITGLRDQYNPVAKGDVIKNTLYDPDTRYNFVLMGRFVEPLTKGDVKRILENMGNKVSDKVTAYTDFVVIGRPPVGEEATPIEQSEEYGKALNWDVKILKLKNIRSFLKLH